MDTAKKVYEIETDIMNGVYDAHMSNISAAIVARREMLSRRTLMILQRGTAVRFNRTVKPTYLRGATGVVESLGRKRVTIRLDNPTGRFRGLITAPPSLIELVPKGVDKTA